MRLPSAVLEIVAWIATGPPRASAALRDGEMARSGPAAVAADESLGAEHTASARRLGVRLLGREGERSARVAANRLTSGGDRERHSLRGRRPGRRTPRTVAYTVTSFARDQRLAGQGAAGPVRFSEEYTLGPDHDAGDRTRLRYAMRAEPRGIFKPARRPIAAQLRRLLDSDLERFETLVETTTS
jgi:hypothetical protein